MRCKNGPGVCRADNTLEVQAVDMILYVKDAKEKECPMGGKVFPRGRSVDKCIGPDCPMWCTWAPLSEVSSSNEDVPLIAGNRNKSPDADEKGYCGLPGSYLKEQKFFCGL